MTPASMRCVDRLLILHLSPTGVGVCREESTQSVQKNVPQNIETKLFEDWLPGSKRSEIPRNRIQRTGLPRLVARPRRTRLDKLVLSAITLAADAFRRLVGYESHDTSDTFITCYVSSRALSQRRASEKINAPPGTAAEYCWAILVV